MSSSERIDDLELARLEEKRWPVAEEIVSSELTYLQTLETLVEVWLEPLQRWAHAAASGPAPPLTSSQISCLFRNAESITSLHKQFYSDLRARREEWAGELGGDGHDGDDGPGGGACVSPCVSDLFLAIAPFMRLYISYCNLHSDASSLLKEVLEHRSYVGFQRFHKEQRLHPRCKGDGLASFLISPVQRVPRYRLLLAQLLKYTHPMHPDYEGLVKALALLEAVAEQINEEIRSSEARRQLLEIQDEFLPKELLIAPHRSFKRKGVLNKVCRRSVKPFTFFCFSDLLIYASAVSWKYKVHRRLVIDARFRVEDVPNGSYKHNCAFKIVSVQKSFYVLAANDEEKHSWLALLRECIEAQRKVISFSAASATDTMSSTVSSDSECSAVFHLAAAPMWQPDEEVDQCPSCEKAFGLLRRKHHCRKCGLCASCSSNRRMFEIGGSKQRVCDPCATEIDAILQHHQSKLPSGSGKSGDGRGGAAIAAFVQGNSGDARFSMLLAELKSSDFLSRARDNAEKSARLQRRVATPTGAAAVGPTSGASFSPSDIASSAALATGVDELSEDATSKERFARALALAAAAAASKYKGSSGRGDGREPASSPLRSDVQSSALFIIDEDYFDESEDRSGGGTDASMLTEAANSATIDTIEDVSNSTADAEYAHIMRNKRAAPAWAVDKWFWVPHEELAFAPAQMCQDASGFQFFRTMDGVVMSSDAVPPVSELERIGPAMQESLYGYSGTDNADLMLLNSRDCGPASVLHQLRERYRRDEIYSSVSSDLLISINPFKLIPIYGAATLARYAEASRRDLHVLPPHIYGIAATAFRTIFDDRDVSIVITGESGSGKTECGRSILQFLSEVGRQCVKLQMQRKQRSKRPRSRTNRLHIPRFHKSSQSESFSLAEYAADDLSTSLGSNMSDDAPIHAAIAAAAAATATATATATAAAAVTDMHAMPRNVEEDVLQTNPLLEAFGNAKTARNDNSSRFGKWLSVEFCRTASDPSSQFAISGATVNTYLLETTRVVYQAPNERTFHIMYQVCAGANAGRTGSKREQMMSNSASKDSIQSDDSHLRVHWSRSSRGKSSKRSRASKTFSSQRGDEVRSELEFLQTLGVGTASDYRCLTRGDCVELDGVDDEDALTTTLIAMKRIGFSSVDICQALQLLVGVMELGNVEFESEGDQLDAECHVLRSTQPSLDRAADLLGLKPGALVDALTMKKKKVVIDVVLTPMTLRESRQARDAVMKSVYGRIFDWIVYSINTLLLLHNNNNNNNNNNNVASGSGNNSSGNTDAAAALQRRVIGVLDYFGFEKMDVNSFEQLLINYSNEKLQAFFVNVLFHKEQDELQREGIIVDKVGYEDNSECLELLEAKQPVPGIIETLHEVAQLATRKVARLAAVQVEEHPDDALMLRLRNQFASESRHSHPVSGGRSSTTVHGQNAAFDLVIQRPHCFIIRHYAGEVEYQVDGFKEKNQDKLDASLADCMASSTASILRDLFNLETYSSMTTKFLASASAARRGSSSSGSSSTAPKNAGASKLEALMAKKRAEKSTKSTQEMPVGTKFREQLGSLVHVLESTTPLFVRCICPNGSKKPFTFDSVDVMWQMKSSGLLQALNVRKLGFPHRALHRAFWERLRPVVWLVERYWTCPMQPGQGEFVDAGADADALVKAQCSWIVSVLCTSTHPMVRRLAFAKIHLQIGESKVFWTSDQELALDTIAMTARNMLSSKISAFLVAAYNRKYGTPLDELQEEMYDGDAEEQQRQEQQQQEEEEEEQEEQPQQEIPLSQPQDQQLSAEEQRAVEDTWQTLADHPRLRDASDYVGRDTPLFMQELWMQTRCVRSRMIPNSLLVPDASDVGFSADDDARDVVLNAAALNAHALDAFSNILSYSGEVFHAYPMVCAHALLDLGVRIREVRDEIFCQLIKQTTLSLAERKASPPSAPGGGIVPLPPQRRDAADQVPRGVILAWRLLYMCLYFFCPTSRGTMIILHRHLTGAVERYRRGASDESASHGEDEASMWDSIDGIATLSLAALDSWVDSDVDCSPLPEELAHLQYFAEHGPTVSSDMQDFYQDVLSDDEQDVNEQEVDDYWTQE